MNHEAKIVEAIDRIVDVQDHLVGGGIKETMAERLTKQAPSSEILSGNRIARINITQLELKTAITSTNAINDRLAPSFKPAIDQGTRRTLRIRNIIPSFPTANAAIEMPVKDSSSAGSPITQSADNTSFGEGAYTFRDSFIPVSTIGHFVPVSKQVYEDAGTLDALINTELLHGLALNVEDQILNADGTAQTLTGLLDAATAWANESPNITNEIDVVRSAMKQMRKADFNPSHVLLNPDDAFDMDIRKSGASNDDYVAGPPKGTQGSLWNLPVIETNSIASGTFLVIDADRAAILFEREQATVEIAAHDGDNFQRNMLTVRAMERLALVITNPLALVKGSL